MRLRKRPSHLREVTPPQKRGINLGKILYFLFLLGIVIFLVKKWGKGLIYIKGYGQIKISRLNVQEITDIRILKIFVKEGQEVEKGEILFSFTRKPEFTQAYTLLRQEEERRIKEQSKIKDELDKLYFNLRKKRKERSFILNELERTRRDYQQLKKLSLLKTVTLDQVEKLEKEQEKLRQQKSLIDEEINYYIKRIKHLEQLIMTGTDGLKMKADWWQFPGYTEIVFTGNRNFNYEVYEGERLLKVYVKGPVKEATTVPPHPVGLIERVDYIPSQQVWEVRLKRNFTIRKCLYSFYPGRLIVQLAERQGPKGWRGERRVSCYQSGEVFRSPFSGMVTRIYFSDHEVALKGEKIMTIFQSGEIHIKGFFEQKDLKYLRAGDSVIIEFPDSERFEGKIVRLYFASLPLPPEFQKKYEPVHRSIVADIVPVDLEKIKNREIEKMSVTIWVRKKLF